jgi:hypothetical protein
MTLGYIDQDIEIYPSIAAAYERYALVYPTLSFEYWIGCIDDSPFHNLRLDAQMGARDYVHSVMDIHDIMSHKSITEQCDLSTTDDFFVLLIIRYIRELPEQALTRIRFEDQFIISTPWMRILFKLIGPITTLRNMPTTNLSHQKLLLRSEQIDLQDSVAEVVNERTS